VAYLPFQFAVAKKQMCNKFFFANFVPPRQMYFSARDFRKLFSEELKKFSAVWIEPPLGAAQQPIKEMKMPNENEDRNRKDKDSSQGDNQRQKQDQNKNQNKDESWRNK
jgi:hypothetical protein